jgi:FixJ family two-component response regulator
MSDRKTICVIDDDPDVLRALERLLGSAGHVVVTFTSPDDFLARFEQTDPACLVLDLAMPGTSGLELQRALEVRARAVPVIFLTGRGDVTTSVQAMKHGAVDFLTKPVDDSALLAAVDSALARHTMLRRASDEFERIAARLSTLTPRERQVLEGLVAGQLNKQVAAHLGTVEKTVKFHRANLMRKLGVRSFADLVKLAERAGIGRGSAA